MNHVVGLKSATVCIFYFLVENVLVNFIPKIDKSHSLQQKKSKNC